MIHFDNWQIKQEGGIIARQYDNLTRRLDVLGDFPEGWTWELLVQVGKKFDVITLSPTEEGMGVLLKASMLALGGQYAVQLRGTRGEEVRHTNVLYSVLIPESLSGSEAWPEVPSAVEQALRQLEELNQHPPYPGDHGYWMVWDVNTGAYMESQLPLPEGGGAGADGGYYTPAVQQTSETTIAVSYTASKSDMPAVEAVEVTLPRGEKGEDGAPGKDGADGAPGDPGKDGVSPTASVQQTETGATITITDESGTTTATVKNGENGKDGQQGHPGADGKTPQKGVDYYTEQDKQEMVQAVIAALPVYNGEVE